MIYFLRYFTNTCYLQLHYKCFKLYPPEVRSIKYCRLGLIMEQYSLLVNPLQKCILSTLIVHLFE